MILLVDSNNLAYRANVTHKHLMTTKGERVGAILGTLQMIQTYIKPSEGKWTNRIYEVMGKQGVTGTFAKVVAAWDFGKSKFRTQLFTGYKAQRAKKREKYTEEEKEEYKDFKRQMDEMHEVLPDFGIRSLKLLGWEADDLIYAVTKSTDEHCVIVSTDKDMLQLVSDRVYVWSPFKEVLITPGNFEHVVGVPKKFYMDYRILVGDYSDNLRGVPGIGDKTAKSLIYQYGGIPNMFAHQQELMKSTRASKIFTHTDVINRNKDLMCMSQVPLEEISDYVDDVLEKGVTFNEGKVKSFFMQKQFISLLTDFIGWTEQFRKLV